MILTGETEVLVEQARSLCPPQIPQSQGSDLVLHGKRAAKNRRSHSTATIEWSDIQTACTNIEGVTSQRWLCGRHIFCRCSATWTCYFSPSTCFYRGKFALPFVRLPHTLVVRLHTTLLGVSLDGPIWVSIIVLQQPCTVRALLKCCYLKTANRSTVKVSRYMARFRS